MMKKEEQEYLNIYRAHVKDVQQLVCRVIPQREDAEEIIQNAFLKAFRHLKDFRGQSATLQTWLLRIALNEVRTHWRKRHVPLVSLSEEECLPDELTPPEEQTEMRIGFLQRAVQLLDPDDQTLLHLYYTDELSLRQIGELLDRTPAQLAKRLQNLRHRLYNIIKRMEQYEEQ